MVVYDSSYVHFKNTVQHVNSISESESKAGLATSRNTGTDPNIIYDEDLRSIFEIFPKSRPCRYVF